jgi:predicted DNA-binding transcriptional regulator YafY
MGKSVLLMRLVELLRENPGMSAAEIARELNKSERTIYRYIRDLTDELGIPVECNGGYRLAGDARLTPINFTPEEVMAIRMALNAAPLRKTEPLARHAGSALRKVETTMSDTARKYSERAKGKVFIVPPTPTPVQLKETLLPQIEEALLNEKTLRLRYWSANAPAAADRLYDPYALVFRSRHWYLLGYCHSRKQVLQLRLDRVLSATPTGDSFRRPEDFSVEKFYRNSWEIMTGDPVQVQILFDAAVARRIKETVRHPTQKVTDREDGSIIFSAEVAGLEEIGRWVLTFAGHARVLSPPEFVEWMTDRARELSRNYPVGSGSIDQRAV